MTTMKKTVLTLGAFLLMIPWPALGAESDTGGVDAASDTTGYIYGQVLTDDGKTYEGRIVWNGDEETFWGDIFNGSKDELPYTKDVPERKRRESIDVFGIKIGWSTSKWEHNRSFSCRFGDISKIEIAYRDEAVLHMKDGAKIELDGGSNDLGADILVVDKEKGNVELEWRDVEEVRLMPAPADLPVVARRLFGTVKTKDYELRGFIEWDKDERLSDESLDGEDENGKDRKILMGDLRSIARNDRRSSKVILKDGTEMILSGTNDVNSENRGVVVEDPAFGRVTLDWEMFESVTFEDGGSGPAYDAYQDGGALHGRVFVQGGDVLEGDIVYDIDEERRWEMLDGESEGMDYEIPFGLVRTLENGGEDVDVVLRDGAELTLGNSVDVNEKNAGIVVVKADGRTSYVAWEDVKKVEFEGAAKGNS